MKDFVDPPEFCKQSTIGKGVSYSEQPLSNLHNNNHNNIIACSKKLI